MADVGDRDERDESDELPEPVPPEPVEVARRALILSGVVCRAHLEHYTDKEYRRQTAEDIHEWFTELNLWPHLEPDEEKIVRAKFGKLPHRLEVRGTWYVEGLGILAWALNRNSFPPHDAKVGPVAVTNALDFLSPDAAELLASPELRPAEELKAAREWFYDVHCTLRGFLHWGGDGHLASWIGDYLAVLKIDPAAVMAGNGLAYKGKPLADADLAELEEWEHVVCQRHRAVMWLEGSDEPYTDISVDT